MEEKEIVLASASPRRSELLRQLGIPHRVLWRDVDEDACPPGLLTREIAAHLARKKVEAAMALPEARNHRFILGADTLVVAGGRLLGKPVSVEDAAAFLRLLSGDWHEVVSAVALLDRATAEILVNDEVARVFFAPLDEADLAYLLDGGEWRGVAGAYRIQSRAGALVVRMEGSFSTVVGLPLHLVYGMLKAARYPLAGKFSASVSTEVRHREGR